MQARRRLQDETDLDRRLAVFGAAALGERMKQALEGLASEYHPKSAPDRRALEAGLSDAAEPLFARLAALREVESEFAAAGPERRFDAWRVWLTGVRAVFAEADRSWQVAARLLPEPRPRPRRWWRGGMPLVLVVSLGLLSGGWR
jgi:hypothetical protein